MTPRFIDLSNGRPEAADSRLQAAILETLQAAHRSHPGRRDALSLYGSRADARFLPQHARRLGMRADAGVAMLRQYEYVKKNILEEPLPPQNAFKLFRVLNETPVGARTVTARRFARVGEAAFYRGGQQVPGVQLSQGEETWPVHHIVTSVRTDIFEQASANFAGIDAMPRLTRTAYITIDQFLNDNLFSGNEDIKFLGLMNQPYLARATSGVNYYADGSTSADTVLADLNKWANWPAQNSRQAFAPNRCAASPRVRDFLMTTPRSTGTDTTIGQFFGNTNAYIQQIDAAHELVDVGGSKVDGILFYRDDVDTAAIDMPQAPTQLPLQTLGFENVIYFYASCAGLQFYNVGNAILVLVNASA